MQQYNATDAIFFGFRVVKRDPLMVIAIAVLTVVVSVGGALLTLDELASFTTALQGIESIDADADPNAFFSAFFGAYGAYFGSPKVLALILLGWLLSLAMQGAILRDLVRDRREGWAFGLQLGGDELRIFVVSLIIWIMVFGLYLGLVFALSLVSGLFSLASPALGVIVALIGVVACVLALALFGVRMSAAAAASIGEKKFILFGSWRITKGRMWGLLGAFVILVFIAFVAFMAVFVLAALVAPQATGFAQGVTPVTDPETARATYSSPGYLFVVALQSVLTVLVTAAWSGVGAYAYRKLGPAAGYPNADPQGGPAAAFE